MNLINLTIALLIASLATTTGFSQIKSGPMLGYNTLREASIWLETSTPQTVELEYWAKGNSRSKVKIKKNSTDESGNTITFATHLLEPGTTYEYQLKPKSGKKSAVKEFTTQTLWHWRTSPPDFSFLTGSCVYINEPAYDRPGKGYGGQYDIFKHMEKEEASFMVWLGDNNYLREVDLGSRSGIYHRYSHSRGIPEVQSFLSSMPHYAIWDDHDYGPNDSDWTYSLKDITKEAFFNYWPMPNRGIGGSEGITNSFTYNDCQFFLMDNRWYREPSGRESKILGDQQMKWLIDALRSSKANFKFVCIGGQFLSDAAIFENHANYPCERQVLIDAIDQFDIKNVIFLTGDRHHSELTMLKTKRGTKIYDITASPITSKAYNHTDEPNRNRVEGSTIGERNYASISITGPFKKREASITFKNASGEVIKTHALK